MHQGIGTFLNRAFCVAKIVNMNRGQEPTLFRLIHQGTVDIRRHVIGATIDMIFDEIDFQAREARDASSRFRRRLSNRVQSAGVKPGAIGDPRPLFVADLDALQFVGRCRTQRENRRDAVVCIDLQTLQQILAYR